MYWKALIAHARFLLCIALSVLVLAACNTAPSATQAGPTALPSAADVEAVARSFLNGWVNGNYAAMYAVLSPKSLIIDPVTFANTYKAVQDTLKISANGMSYVIHSEQTERQGNTVTVDYDVTFDSAPLGKFTDASRTMRLLLVGDVWRVAWSGMDIFEGMAGGAKLSIVYTQSKRGAIYDRNGNVIAQDNVPNYAIRLLPGKYPTGKALDCFRFLAQNFPVRADDLDKAYGHYTEQQFRNFGFTVGVLSEDEYKQLKPQLDSACYVEAHPQTTRYYFGGTFAAQTVGYLSQIQPGDLDSHPGYAKDALVGRQGVEQTFEGQLAGKSGAELVITTLDGVLVRTIFVQQPTGNQDVTLTLDRDLQLATERALASAFSVANWAPYSTGAAAVVLDPNTGQILALASYPTISPDAFLPTTSFDVKDVQALYHSQRATRNRATQETYAAGSVFKIVSLAGATQAGAVTLNDTYTDSGIWDGSKLGDQVRKDWIYLDKYSPTDNHGTLTFQQALTASCDTCFWQVGWKLDGIDPSLFRKYANQMGLGVKTGVDPLLQEEAGNIPDPTWKVKTIGKPWGLGDSLNTVIGQGDVQVTPIQVARMMMGIANGGTLYHPVLVTKVGNAVGVSYSSTPMPPDNDGLSPQTIKGIQDALCAVTSDAKIGTANFVFYNWNFKRVEVCAKTGTAQTDTLYPNGWFTAFTRLSGQKADLAIALLVEHSREGSETAGPIVRRIIESYYHLPQEPWPDYWTSPYEPMVDPNLSDGVVHLKKPR